MVAAVTGQVSPRTGSGPMLDDLAYDDSAAPAIGLVPPGVSWDEIRDHIKIAHSHLLIPPGSDGEYVGAYWSGTEMLLVSELGDDQDEAIAEFRDFLQEHGET
jgi:hypothetical protein